MDEDGLWRLFFATGLPQAYLAAAEARGGPRRQEVPARPAFWPEGERAGRS